MRTHVACEGVGPSNIKSICQPGGEILALGGAVILQIVPTHLKAGMIVLAPIVLPWVLDVAEMHLLRNGNFNREKWLTEYK